VTTLVFVVAGPVTETVLVVVWVSSGAVLVQVVPRQMVVGVSVMPCAATELGGSVREEFVGSE
jgi:hypothetical protein